MVNEVTSDIPKCPTEIVMADQFLTTAVLAIICLLYTSDAADE